jgi:Ni/Co efflux regulator RcnB
MSESEMISRRKAFSLLGLMAAFSLAAAPTVLTMSDAEAQYGAPPATPPAGEKTGGERRHERRKHRGERREERHEHRRKRRHERHETGSEQKKM